MKKIKIIAFALSLLFVFNVNGYVLSSEANAANPVYNQCELTDATNGSLELQKTIDALSLEELKQQGCIKRIESEERSLYDVVYKQDNGNHVAYIFNEPVKYIDASGQIKDIDLSIKRIDSNEIYQKATAATYKKLLSEYDYASLESNVKVFYSGNYDETKYSVVAVKDNWIIGVSPYEDNTAVDSYTTVLCEKDSGSIVASKATKPSDSFKSIEYITTASKSGAVQYAPVYSGFSQSYTTSSADEAVSFVLSTGGLVPVVAEDNGSVKLVDPDTNKVIATLGQVYVNCDDESITNGIYSVKCIDELTDKYVVSIEAINKQAMMTADYTNYTIRSTATLRFNASSYNIDDAAVYSLHPNENYGNAAMARIGYVSTDVGVGSMLIRFSGMAVSDLYRSVPKSDIASVMYHFRTIDSKSLPTRIGAYYYTGNGGSTWSEDTVTYQSADVDSHTGDFVADVTVSDSGLYSLDITSAALLWRDCPTCSVFGLVLKNLTSTSNSNYMRILATVEHGTFMPYVTVEYKEPTKYGPFTSPNEAAKDFAQRFYNASRYVRMEISATIYSTHVLGGDMKYYYTYVAGQHPHQSNVNHSIPKDEQGASIAAFIHTHLNVEDYSDQDRSIVNGAIVMYLVTPSKKIKRLSTSGENVVYSSFMPTALTEYQKQMLVDMFRSVWEYHINNESCIHDCQNKTWPNEQLN